jgi:hypothetical protein
MSADGRVRLSTELEAAAWIAPRLGPFGVRIDSVVPAGFEAYARIFHPAIGPREKRATWAEVAAWAGKVMHPHAEFEQIERRIKGEGAGRTYGAEPRMGALEPELVGALAELLRHHTQSPERCWFCVWEGGWVQGPGSVLVSFGTPVYERAEIQREWASGWERSFSGDVSTAPRVRLPGRDYVLLEGPLDAVGEIGASTHWQGKSWFEPESPNLWWPDDRAWCVATEIDLDSTYVGGSATMIRELLSDSRFDALEVRAADQRGDLVNVTK